MQFWYNLRAVCVQFSSCPPHFQTLKETLDPTLKQKPDGMTAVEVARKHDWHETADAMEDWMKQHGVSKQTILRHVLYPAKSSGAGYRQTDCEEIHIET